MSRKRKHGVSSTPMTFSTQHHAMFSQMKRNGINVSEWIDEAISYRQKHLAHAVQADTSWDAAKAIIESHVEIPFEAFIMRKAWALSRAEEGEFHGWTVEKPTEESEREQQQQQPE
jgi:hypothetical protein